MKLLILGAGGYGQTVADIARQSDKYELVAYLDDNSANNMVIGKCSEFMKHKNQDTEMYPAFGNNQMRLDWIEKLQNAGIEVPVLVHPSAYISPTAAIENGTVILPKAVVNTNCTIKKGCIINCGAIVDHGCVLDEGVHICLGAIVKAENHILPCFKIEAGEVVANRTYPL